MNFLAAKVTNFDGGLFVFIGVIFIMALISLFVFCINGRSEKPLLETKCKCEKCQNPKEECECAPECENCGSCTEVELTADEQEAYEAFVGTETEEVKEEPSVEEPVEEEVIVETTWEGKDVKRDVMIDLLKTANVKGISKLSKADLRAKCIEMGIVCPV